jgi:phytoene dehydrogenase-like protein
MNTSSSDYLIIGAGFSGLSLAALLAKSGKNVICLEAHSLPGGCGSFFKREGLTFDVGATTLSGLQGGFGLELFFQQLGSRPEMQRCQLGMVIKQGEKTIRRYCDHQQWLAELNRNFPDYNHKNSWEKVAKINQLAWSLTPDSRHYPPRSWHDLLALSSNNLSAKFSIFPYIFKSTQTAFFEKRPKQDYTEFLNEQLIISAQGYIDRVPAMIGAMALSYPEDVWYPMGGIGRFALWLKNKAIENGAKFKMSTKVTSLVSGKNSLEIFTHEGERYIAQKVISTLPLWNTQQLLKEQNFSKLSKYVQRFSPQWGALCGYFRVKQERSVAQLESLYYQLHTRPDSDFFGLGSKSLFCSFSDPKDKLRAPEGYQAMTVSTHVDLKSFYHLSRHVSPPELKDRLKCYFLEHLKSSMPEIQAECLDVATPFTFEKYTSRVQGSVGGIPHDLGHGVLGYPQSATGHPNLIQMGDTTFPGQGIVGVIQGSLNFYFNNESPN